MGVIARERSDRSNPPAEGRLLRRGYAPPRSDMVVLDWKTIPYREAWERQETLRGQRRAGTIADTLVLCEHPPTFTIGKQDCREDWKATFDVIQAAGIEVVQTNRGGRLTYHGPGQLVGYCIVDIQARGLGIATFVKNIEALLMATLARCNVIAERDPVNPGVYVGRDKIGAIGLHVSHGITQHGFALNYATRLTDYQYIVPCGLKDRGITSLKRLLGDTAPDRKKICEIITALAEKIFYSAASKVGSASPAEIRMPEANCSS